MMETGEAGTPNLAQAARLSTLRKICSCFSGDRPSHRQEETDVDKADKICRLGVSLFYSSLMGKSPLMRGNAATRRNLRPCLIYVHIVHAAAIKLTIRLINLSETRAWKVCI